MRRRAQGMSLRARMGLAAGVAVAIAVFAVAFSSYEGTRSELVGGVDSSLRQIARPVLLRACVVRGPRLAPAFTPLGDGSDDEQDNQAPTSCNSWPRGDPDEGLSLDRQPSVAFGGASGTLTLVRPDGSGYTPTGSSLIPADRHARSLAAAGHGQYFADREVNGAHIRVLVTGLGKRGALEVALPLEQLDQTLRHQALLLILIAAGGIALAALLGVLVARAAVAPIARFTSQTEAIAQRPDRIETERLEVRGGDELARLAHTFNTTLDTLSESVRAQRNLVADASHELRTPIASIRANLQLMRDESLLTSADREALRADVIEELDQLTRLVSDVVELARGSKSNTEPGDLRVDEVVLEVVQRARRRAPRLAFQTSLEPTLIHGDGERVARAVSNLLDNAAKWSPEGETVEVTLKAGVLSVRDHGPGFNPDDLPFVFDRFHRAKQARSKPGSGLGLAIVRQAAEAHDGWARATNAPGGGALLSVNFGAPLPLGDPAPPTPVRA